MLSTALISTLLHWSRQAQDPIYIHSLCNIFHSLLFIPVHSPFQTPLQFLHSSSSRCDRHSSPLACLACGSGCTACLHASPTGLRKHTVTRGKPPLGPSQPSALRSKPPLTGWVFSSLLRSDTRAAGVGWQLSETVGLNKGTVLSG